MTSVDSARICSVIRAEEDDLPDTRLEVVVFSVGRSDGSRNGRPDGSVALGRMSNIGSDEHGLGGDSGLINDETERSQFGRQNKAVTDTGPHRHTSSRSGIETLIPPNLALIFMDTLAQY